ncbi:hypothetical protein [Hahella sp. NBU794]|uniref:hypothetical protein n=1 Tax=Hahella sp. NBU794 TaxID=3422590 RepID=UPI003D6F4B92
MEIELTAKEKLNELSERLGCKLEIRKFWADEFNPGFYFRFYGLVSDAIFMKVEVAGSYYFGLRNGEKIEEIDIFPFDNGERVSPCNTEHYLWVHRDSIQWDSVEMGYECKYSMAELLLE